MGLEDLQKVRLEKLNKIKELGINPYPAKTTVTHNMLNAKQAGEEKITVAGRLRSLRPHGKIIFADIEDTSGKIQLFFASQNFNEKECRLLLLLDIGDFIQVSGEIFTTQAGEITIRVSEFKLLTKSLRPLPSQWHGLKDIEERNRRRYLDLLMNPAVKSTFEYRSKIVYAIRKFLVEEKGYFEVENPVLQPIYGGTRARPFKTHHNTLDTDLYLRISNELYLKRLIVGGFEKVFEIGHTFRNEGMDRNHNPEFTMLETMQAYADYKDNMNLIEEMFEYVCLNVFGKTQLEYQGTILEFKRPWKRVKLADLFKEKTGVEFQEINTLEKATALAKKVGVSVQDYMTDGEILLEIFEKKCTSELVQPTFVYDYPADFFPLAKPKSDNPKIVQSFDIYVAGMEMGTNYSEQNNPLELKEAWEKEKKKSQEGNPEAQLTDEDFLESLEYGMPPTSGIGPGLDRWVMVFTNSFSIADVIAFPTLKPEKRLKSNEPSKKEDKNTGITREEAYSMLTEMISNKNLIRHGVAVEAIMRSLARRFGESEEEWGIVGLLHDADYEATDKDLKRHTLVISEMLRKKGVSGRIINGIQAHGDMIKPDRENNLEKAVYAADELSGLITACALVRPDKKLASVDVESVLKKFKSPSFAAGAKRENILTCESELGIKLKEFIEIALKAMQEISSKLGL